MAGKKVVTALVAMLFATAIQANVAHAADVADKPSRPNIVLIMADDLGFSDLGCYGGEIQTPNLDRLAAGGLRFTQFYNAGRCCPTRASLLTGLYAHQTGIGLMEDDLGLPNYRGFLKRKCLTIAEVLRTGGYRTLMAGKWNVGYQAGQWPLDRGFERYFGLLRGASDYFDPRVGGRAKIAIFGLDRERFDRFDEKFYTTDAFTDFAIDRIGEVAGPAAQSEQPFFLYLAYTAPHSPLQAWPEDITKYRGRYRTGWDEIRAARHRRQIEQGIVRAEWPLTPRDPRVREWERLTEAERDAEDLKMAVFAAQVDRLDQNVGRLMATLRELGIERNTLVLFLSDNGGDGENEGATKLPPGPKGSSHIYGRGWANVSNTPFRGYKHAMHEGGIASPLIAYWPAVIKKPEVSDAVAHVTHLLPTCLDVAGVEYPETSAREATIFSTPESQSLLPLLRHGARPDTEVFWEHEGNRAVRNGKWKLVADHGRPWELYDMKEDRTELNDLAAAKPEFVETLAGQYDYWAKRAGVLPWDKVRAARKK